MTEDSRELPQSVKNLGWRVTFAGLGINLGLGILYTWSVIASGIPEEWNFDASDKSWIYGIACLVFCLVMVPAGRMQDKLGPRLVASIGGILVGIGMIVTSFNTTPLGFIIGFSVLLGTGLGFGYASATPPAVKWFPAAKTGLIAGIVVSGFGLASVYVAPLAEWLTEEYGLQTMLRIMGVAFVIIVVGLAQFLVAPPKGYVPPGTPPKPANGGNNKKENFSPKEMLGTSQFYVLWFMYACGAGAGLMIIGVLGDIAGEQAGVTLGFVLVAALAVGNGAGRVVAGVLSDKLGRTATMFGSFVFQAGLVLLLSQATVGSPLANVYVLAVVSALIGANYGANLSLFPSITKDFYGLKHFGMNYGLVFTAWGVGGFLLSKLAGELYVRYETLDLAYYGAAALLVAAAIAALTVKAPHHFHETAEKPT
jgi:OFA family oxalate/formate antiporter-like MFS transporter